MAGGLGPSRAGYSPFVRMTVGERAILLSTIAFVALVVGALNLVQVRADLALIFVAFVVYLGVLAIPLVVYRRGWGWFHPIIFLPLWALATGVLPSLGVYTSGIDRHAVLRGMTDHDLNNLVVQGLLLQALGWLVFYASFLSWGRKRIVNLRFPEPHRITVKAFLVAGVSFASFVVLMQAAGGLDPLMLQRAVRADQRLAAELGGQWAFLVRRMLPIACLVWLALRPAAIRRPVFWCAFGAGLFMAFAASGSRSGIVMPLVMALAIWALRTSRVPYFRAGVLAALALVVVGIGSEFRAETRRVSTVQDVSIELGLVSGFQRGLEERIGRAGETSALIAILGRVPDEVGFLYGRSYLSIPAAPIPSRIWAGKPEAGGRLTGELVFGRPPSGGAVPPGTVGEAYWNFHVPGVVAVFFLWGMFANWLARFYREHAQHGGVVALYVITLFGFSPNSGAFYGWLQSIAVALFALVLFCGWPRVTRAPRERLAPPQRVPASVRAAPK